MFPIPLPWVAFAVGLALLGTYRGGYHFGWEDRDKEMQIEIAKKNEEARELEKNMAQKLADKETALRKAKDDVKKKQSAMRELANTGRMRLPTSSCVQASTSASPTTGDSRDEPSELERQTINTLIDLVAEGDKAIVKHNACVAAYNEMREIVNGKR